MSDEEINIDEDDLLLENLDDSELIVEEFDEGEEPDGPPSVESVLFGAFKQGLSEVSIVGKTEDGTWFFASSNENPIEVDHALIRFRECLEDYI